ncbi:hypothetical protein SRHO_G00281870 [Serrasalmus rhombeus]
MICRLLHRVPSLGRRDARTFILSQAEKPLCWAVVTPPSVRELLSAVAGFAKRGIWPSGVVLYLTPGFPIFCKNSAEKEKTVYPKFWEFLSGGSDNKRGPFSDLTLGYR